MNIWASIEIQICISQMKGLSLLVTGDGDCVWKWYPQKTQSLPCGECHDFVKNSQKKPKKQFNCQEYRKPEGKGSV